MLLLKLLVLRLRRGLGEALLEGVAGRAELLLRGAEVWVRGCLLEQWLLHARVLRRLLLEGVHWRAVARGAVLRLQGRCALLRLVSAPHDSLHHAVRHLVQRQGSAAAVLLQ